MVGPADVPGALDRAEARVRELGADYEPPTFDHVPDADAAIFLCAVDHKTGYSEAHEVDGEGPFSGSELMWLLGLKAAAHQPGLLTSRRLRYVSAGDVAEWFRAGSEPIADPERRAFLWRDLAAGLERDYSGSAQELLDAAAGRLGAEGGLLDRLAPYGAYSDPLAKKAFLFAKIAERRGWLEVSDPETWQVSADNVLMRLASLVNLGHHMFYEEFRNTVINGKGPMPGLVHVDETSLKALFRYLGGDPERRSFGPRSSDEVSVEGPVVASGGVAIKPDAQRGAPMQEYPEDVKNPEMQYTTSYGLDWPGLIDPPWSSILAYDLNEGIIKWKRPIGVDSLYAQGDESKGAPGGTLRKGMVISSTGVVFANAKGGKVYAFDAEDGRVLWETTLSHESNAQPSMYTLDGKEYLVINATSDFGNDSYDHSKKQGALPKGYIVYGIPEKE